MKFCSQCGAAVELITPEGDNRERFVCASCAHIHYQNPRIVAGCLVAHGDQVLLCRRGIEPRHGYWTLPAGFLELGEAVTHGAVRETREEALAEVSEPELYTVFSLPHISQVYMFFRAALQGERFGAGAETLEARLFSEHEIPWEQLAFPVITQTLQFFFDDLRRAQFEVRHREITRVSLQKPL